MAKVKGFVYTSHADADADTDADTDADGRAMTLAKNVHIYTRFYRHNRKKIEKIGCALNYQNVSAPKQERLEEDTSKCTIC